MSSSFDVNLDDRNAVSPPNASVSPSRTRRFEMAAAARKSPPSSANKEVSTPVSRENRFKQTGTSSSSTFMDFGRVPDLQKPTESPIDGTAVVETTTTKSTGFGKSRFAAFANAEVAYVKGIHDEIQSVLSEEQGTSEEITPKFTSMDLARLISRVMVNLNLQPTKDQPEQPINGPNSQRHWVSSSPPGAKPTPQELQATVTMQNVLVSELGKSMQKITKHNTELVEFNKKLIVERNNALQARDDLLNILSKEQEEKKALLEREKENNDPQQKRRANLLRSKNERQFFDEEAILDAAIQAFQSAQQPQPIKATVEVEGEEKSETLDSSAPEEPANGTDDIAILPHKEQIKYAADMMSVVNETPYTKEHRNGTVASISKEFQQRNNMVSNYINTLSNSAKEWDRKVLQADSVGQYTQLLQEKLVEITASFEEVIQVLAESVAESRQWRLKYLSVQASRNDKVVAPTPDYSKNLIPSYESLILKSYKVTRSISGTYTSGASWGFVSPPDSPSYKAYLPTLLNMKKDINKGHD